MEIMQETTEKIPQQLRQDGIKFVLLEKGGKKPFQKEWQNLTICWNNAELLEHIKGGGNYGVMGGGKNLLIVDFDNEKVQNEVVPKLPKTFTVRTGTGKLHKYFFSDKCESFKIFDEDMNTLADVQGDGKQVVAPNSIHPNGNKYEVVDDSDIAFVSYSEIKAIMTPYDKKPKKEEKKYERPMGISTDDFLEKLKSNISIADVLSSFGIPTSKNPTECPFHSSKGGKCLGYNRETAHCFHCDGSWNVFSLVKDMKKYDFREALQYLSNLAGMEEELEESKRKYIASLQEQEDRTQQDVLSQFLRLTSGAEKHWAEATEILVDYVRDRIYLYTTKDDVKSEMWTYKEGIYVPQGKSEVKILLRNLLEQWYSQYIANLVIAKLETDTAIEGERFFKVAFTDEVPVLNGILNINSRELKPFTPEKIFFSKLPVAYDPNAKCPSIDRFLLDVLGHESDVELIHEIGGFCLMNDYKFEKAFIFNGDGRNGKDKTLELFKRLLGAENCCSIPLASLKPDSFVISELFGKRVNLAGDIGSDDLKDSSMFKALTGRSLVSAKRKFLRDITFVNSAKFIFACNQLPMVYDLSKGYWDRWVLQEFPFTFVTKEELEKATDKNKLKLRDEGIIERITTPEELSGLLNKFLEGMDRLVINRNFSSAKGSDETKTLWIRKSNSFIAFCMDRLEDDFEGRISKKDLRKEYAKYCKQHKIVGKTDFVIRRVLQDMFGVSEVQTDSLGEFRERYWEGIKWKK